MAHIAKGQEYYHINRTKADLEDYYKYREKEVSLRDKLSKYHFLMRSKGLAVKNEV